jgi:plasmid stabilization system protein ParE
MRVAGRQRVRLQLVADRHDAWWRVNRPAAPDLLIRELLHVLQLLEANPNLGAPYEASRFEGPVRRILMKRTERHVYYGLLGDELIILAIWGARRGRGPKL